MRSLQLFEDNDGVPQSLLPAKHCHLLQTFLSRQAHYLPTLGVLQFYLLSLKTLSPEETQLSQGGQISKEYKEITSVGLGIMLPFCPLVEK